MSPDKKFSTCRGATRSSTVTAFRANVRSLLELSDDEWSAVKEMVPDQVERLRQFVAAHDQTRSSRPDDAQRIRDEAAEETACPDCGHQLALSSDTDPVSGHDWFVADCNTPGCRSRAASRATSVTKQGAYEEFYEARAASRGQEGSKA